MNKPTDNRYPIHSLLRDRWSPRAFSEHRIESDKLASIFEAAKWSPSAANLQPWGFLFVTQEDAQAREKLVATLTERNRQWASNVPLLILTLARRVGENGRENRWANYDLGQSVAHLTVEAVSLGLTVHQMGGFDADLARTAFEIPADYDPVTVVALGYPGDPEDLPEDFRQREHDPRKRRAIEEFVFEDRWNNPFRPALFELAGETDTSRN